MTALTVASALQTINATITGITSAPTAMPAHLNPPDLPMVLMYPGPAEHTDMSMRHLRSDRLWYGWVFVKKVGSGRGVDEGYQDALAFLSRFYTKYITQEHTDNAAWNCLRYVRDQGIRADFGLHETGADNYWGFIFELMITTFTASEA